MVRSVITLKNNNGTPKTGATVQIYEYDQNAQDYKGNLIGQAIEIPNKGQYYLVMSEQKIVTVFVNGIREESLTGVILEGKEFDAASRVKDGTIAMHKLTQAARDEIRSGGNITNNPDDVTLRTNASSQIELHPDYQKKIAGDGTSTNPVDRNGAYGHLKNLNVYSPKDYGAVGDGITNDTSAFTDLFNALPGKCIIDLSGGTYLIDAFTVSKSDFVMRNGTLKLNSGSYLLNISSKANIVFENVIFDSNNKGQYFCYISSCSNISFYQSKFQNLGDGTVNTYGLWWRQTDNVLVYGCTFQSLTSSGVTRAIMQTDTADIPSKNAKILKNHFEDIQPSSDADAIYIEATGADKHVNCIISENTFVDCAKRYIKLNAAGIVISKNIGYAKSLTNNMLACISTFGDDVVITDNEFYFNGTLSCSYFVALGSSNPINRIKIIGNICQPGLVVTASVGIYISNNATDLVISQNTLYNFEHAVKDSSSATPTSKYIKILNNHFEGCADHVINFDGDVYDMEVSGNMCPTTIASRLFVNLTGATVQNVIILNNKHSCSSGISSSAIRPAEQRGNYNAGNREDEYQGGIKIRYGTAAPASGTWQTGDRIINTSPTAGGYIGWVCISGGSPGTWKGYGTIEA